LEPTSATAVKNTKSAFM